MSTRVRGRWTRAVGATVSVTALLLATFSPVVAIVRFEPTPEPVRERWVAEVEVAVPWAQVSLRVPAEWKVKVKREPTLGISGGAALLAAFGPGGTVCVLDIYDPQTIETWQDAGVQPARDLTIAGHPAERFDDMIGAGAATASAYSIYAPEWIYSLFCTADRAPTDRWLSVVETLELPPERMP